MSFSATVFNVLIASPSDVKDERGAIAQAMHDWNTKNSHEYKIVFLPIRWETHSIPEMGARSQKLLNERVVEPSDILIGCFWKKIGSPTGMEPSGTIEEISLFLSKNKPIMLYFSQKPGSYQGVDWEQIKKVEDFKESIKDKGIRGDYSSTEELVSIIKDDLTTLARSMRVSPVIDAQTIAASNATTREKLEERPRKEIYLMKSSERGFFVMGYTLGYEEKLEKAGGVLNKTPAGGWAFKFSNNRLEEIAKMLKVSPVIRPKEQ